MLESKALEVNLQVTRVDQVNIPLRHKALLDALENFQGVRSAAEHLLSEFHHPYKNWNVVIDELRSFSLKNLNAYISSSRGPEAVEVLFEIFLDLITRAPKDSQRIKATEGLLAFLEKMVNSLGDESLVSVLTSLQKIFMTLRDAPFIIVQAASRSLHPVSRIIRILSEKLKGRAVPDDFWDTVAGLLVRIQLHTLRYWLGLEDPFVWLKRTLSRYRVRLDPHELGEIEKLMEPISHKALGAYLERVESTGAQKGHFGYQSLDMFLQCPGHLDIVREYRETASRLGGTLTGEKVEGDGHSREVGPYLLFLFHVLEIDGLATIHEEVLRRINRNLLCLVRSADVEQLQQILPKSFKLLKQQVGHFPRTALQCIEALGSEIFKRDNTTLIELFLDQVIKFGFQAPGIEGVDREWHVICNPAHLQNIRVWLNLIGYKPKVCGALLSALLINLRLAGTCIKDTDLFQKDISKLLNSDIAPVYNLVKQLAKTLPVYFNEIGAEGLLRDVSTELDEISHREDVLIHFLRKQSHVESNNLIVNFVEAILCFWYSKDKAGLKAFLPPEILEQVETSGPHIDHIHVLMRHLARSLDLEPFAAHVPMLRNLPEERVEGLLNQVPDVPPQEVRRLQLLIRMYRLETLKYELGPQEIVHHLREAKNWGFDGLEKVIDVIRQEDPKECLDVILDQLERLKAIILSEERFEIREDIYHKRHIAADIPSMYGCYHERKFDALSLSFRLENLANVYFERLITSLEVPFITRTTFVDIARCLRLFWRAIKLNGVHSKKFLTYLTLLEKSLDVRRFTFGQYLDIVRGLSEGVKDMIYVYYISPHQDNLPRIIRQLGRDMLLPKYRNAVNESEDDTQLQNQLSERFLRDLIASTFGLQYLDSFVGQVYQVLAEQKEVLDSDDLDLLLSYDPNKVLCSIHTPSPETENLIHLGNKGFNLVLLAQEGAFVPPGVIVTTEAFRCYSIFQRFPPAYRDFRWRLEAVLKDIEQRKGRRFGNPSNPLLLSVRSGAAISMPGMMATIINVGSNPEIIEGLARKTGNTWFAWDNYRRFVQSWAMSFGLNRDVFSGLMASYKQKYGVEQKRDFTGEAMKDLALAYRQAVLDHGLEIEDDPFEQLIVAIRLVLGSWESEKARAYREIMEISDHWGTAVIVQAMAFGNISRRSGTGVVFTSNPAKKLDRVSLWGDFTPGNQGEDIVSGLVSTYPVSVEQKKFRALNSELCLEEDFPNIYNALLNLVKHLVYEHKWTPQEIEFTFEGPESHQLYILQSRDMTTKKRSIIEVFAATPELERSYLGRGIGVSGGALSGRAAFSLEDITSIKSKNPGTPVILVRSDTVPDDIKEISLADGLLTAKGGQTSHAAIVAFRLDKACVVGCKQLQVFESRGMARIHGRTIRSGDYISIDGRGGTVYLGRHPAQREQEASLV